MKLLLVRHGNTFTSDQTPLWVGLHEDLPLTAEGEAQAESLAQALAEAQVTPISIYCGQLQRTRRAAQIVRDRFNLPAPIVDRRLNELDYGSWGGKSSEEISAAGGEAELAAWEAESIFPKKAAWPEDEAAVTARVQGFIQSLQRHHQENDLVMIVSSNGILRFFLKAFPDAFAALKAQGKLKMKTGAISALDLNAPHNPIFWNEKPAAALIKSLKNN